MARFVNPNKNRDPSPNKWDQSPENNTIYREDKSYNTTFGEGDGFRFETASLIAGSIMRLGGIPFIIFGASVLWEAISSSTYSFIVYFFGLAFMASGFYVTFGMKFLEIRAKKRWHNLMKVNNRLSSKDGKNSSLSTLLDDSLNPSTDRDEIRETLQKNFEKTK